MNNLSFVVLLHVKFLQFYIFLYQKFHDNAKISKDFRPNYASISLTRASFSPIRPILQQRTSLFITLSIFYYYFYQSLLKLENKIAALFGITSCVKQKDNMLNAKMKAVAKFYITVAQPPLLLHICWPDMESVSQ